MKHKESLPWNDKKSPAARLFRMADKKGLPIKIFTEMYISDIKKARIKITQDVINQAHALERQWEAHTKNRVWNLHGTWNGMRDNDGFGKRPKKQSATLAALLAGEKVSKKVQT